MPIGEFGAAPVAADAGQDFVSTPLYWMYEAGHAALHPARIFADATIWALRNPFNPVSHTLLGRKLAAMSEVFERTTRRYGKPDFGIVATLEDGRTVPIVETVVWEKPFCRLLHFSREREEGAAPLPRLVIVAPMSGHYATLLRGTVEAMLPEHDVYITDWVDARIVPLAQGRFDLDDYIDYVVDMLHFLGGDCHVMAVCQPAVPVLAAVARMEADGDADVPHSIVLMGGPIDTRRNPTGVNTLAERRGIDWFARHVISWVPFPHPGMMRPVYPGFLQLSGFVGMNFDRHVSAHQTYFRHLVEGDGDSAEKHREFYDEYLAVMDLAAEFYLQTVDTVFIRHALPKGEMMHRDKPVDPAAIHRVALMTVEGERDDISGVGQTEAAHDLCVNIPSNRKLHYLQMKVGHYGVFNGSRFRKEIVPRIAAFVRASQVGEAVEAAVIDAAPVSTPAASEAPDLPELPVAELPSAEIAALPDAALPDAPHALNGHAVTVAAPPALAFEASPDLLGTTAMQPPPVVPGGLSVALAEPVGPVDDLTRIKGVGGKTAKILNEAGIYHFWQIADLAPSDIGSLDRKLSLPGRIVRDRWLAQASQLAGRS
jgi:poly(3-hydroxybutyrate) depolymerase